MTVLGLRRIIVSVADLDRALALYRDALGLQEKYRAGDVVMLGEPELMLHRRTPTPGLYGVAMSFLVDDVDAATATAEKAGATVVDPPAAVHFPLSHRP